MEGLQSGNYKELAQLISVAAPDLRTYRALQLTAKVFVVTTVQITVQNSVTPLGRVDCAVVKSLAGERTRWVISPFRETTRWVQKRVNSYLCVEPVIKHGVCKRYYRSGALQKATYFCNGSKRLRKLYHPCGKIEGMVRFDGEGAKHGLSLTWTEDSELDSVTPYKHGVLDGTAVAWISNGDQHLGPAPLFSFDPESRPVQYIKNFKDGMLHGNCYEFIYSGRLYQKVVYHQGVAAMATPVRFSHEVKISEAQGVTSISVVFGDERESSLGSTLGEPTGRLPIGGSTPNPFGPEGVERESSLGSPGVEWSAV
jgi:hypothetical protein